MPLYLTGYHSSRVSKTKATPGLRRSASSPFAAAPRTKPALSRIKSLADALDAADDSTEAQLESTGKIVSVLRTNAAIDVLSAIDHTNASLFEPIPSRAGMNSVRIAEILNFRKNLPKTVSFAHIHALLSASSRTEREIQGLLSSNKIRRLHLVGWGNDVSGLGEVLISTAAYEKRLRDSALPVATVEACIHALRLHPKVAALPTSSISHAHAIALTKAGFLVSPSLLRSGAGSNTRAQTPALTRGASGTQDAVGGAAAFEQLGGVGSARRSNSDSIVALSSSELVLSVPLIAQYLKMLGAGREHLLTLLRKSGKHRQLPRDILKERWDGNVDNESTVSTAKQIRGEFSAVMPAKLKKWKDLYGMSFDWILEECLGAGLIELFETHSVGLGVRSLV